MRRRANFSLLQHGSTIPNRQLLFRNSVLLFFETTGSGIRFPIHAFIANLILSGVVSCIFLFFLLEVTVFSPNNAHVFPGKLYCHTFIKGSLLVELDAQLIHVIGSVLLIFGAVKRSKMLCYLYVACSTLSFITSTIIRTAQVFLCEKKQHPKMLPLKYRPDLPEYFKLILMWLVCQLFWYSVVFSFVVAQLEWFNTSRAIEVEMKVDDNLPGSSEERS